MPSRTFSLAIVLSVLTGTLLVNRQEGGMEAVNDFIRFVEGEGASQRSAIYSRDQLLPKFRAVLIQQQPTLANVTFSDLDSENWCEWLRRNERLYGEMMAFTRLSPDELKRAYQLH